MAENLVVNEVTYPEVEAVSMTNEAGEKVAFFPDAVRYNPQELTDAQKSQARTNMGAASAEEVSSLSAEKADKTEIPKKVSDLSNDKGFITGYTETDPTVPDWAKAPSKPSYSKSEVGLGNVDNVKQYSASNPPPYPVTSVNGETGDVKLSAADVGARSITWTPSKQEITAALGYSPVPATVSISIIGKDADGNEHAFTVIGWEVGGNEPV